LFFVFLLIEKNVKAKFSDKKYKKRFGAPPWEVRCGGIGTVLLIYDRKREA
jgi:hypothetical protein